MDIGTAKVSQIDRARHRHEGLDLVEPDEPFSVANYAAHAQGGLASQSLSAPVVLVGGTGLYIRAVARGLPVQDAGHDPGLREDLELWLERQGLAALVAELRQRAPAVAAGTDLQNPRRVVRALERAALAGDRPPPPAVGYPGPVLWLGLSAEPALHRRWIAERAADQFRKGLLEEADALRGHYPETLRAFSAVGYREAFGVLAGTLTLDQAIAASAQRTWIYARRQRTWFRREPDVAWLPAHESDSWQRAQDRARSFLQRVQTR